MLLVWCLEILWLFTLQDQVESETFTIGFISGNTRKDGTTHSELPGVRTSAAMALAVDDINLSGILPEGNDIRFVVAETFGQESVSILQTAKLWRQNISAFIGPQETCVHEARMAASFNLPMISHFCSHYETSDKTLYPTFARTRPPATLISKSAASLLLTFGWTEVAFFHANASGGGSGNGGHERRGGAGGAENAAVAHAIVETFRLQGINIRHHRQWSEMYHYGWKEENVFQEWISETKDDVRIYFILGNSDSHLGLLEAMHSQGLFEANSQGEYFVVGIRADSWDPKDPAKYIRGFLQDKHSEPSEEILEGMRHYLGIMMSAPQESSSWSYANFTRRVKEHMIRGPFANLLAEKNVRLLQLRKEAAYLYDAVQLYAWSLAKTLREGTGSPSDGRLIIGNIMNRSYFSAMGYEVYMDSNGDAEGNYTLVALQGGGVDQPKGLYPVGSFEVDLLRGTTPHQGMLPSLRLIRNITWPSGGPRPPPAIPPCGFRNELCLPHYADRREILIGVFGGLSLVFAVVVIVAYRNYRYEQELDSLLWKVESKELKLDQFTPTGGKLSTRKQSQKHQQQRHSQMSLSSNQETDFRFSTIYTRIGVLRGRIYAVRQVNKASIVINRKLKKELKTMRDLRHDNLNSFVGACVETNNVCIITEYCTRGSLRDLLDNEDVKLDRMFIASLVGDIIRGMTFIHDSALKFHANLKSTNCLVDSRWVLKISDFGLHDFRDNWVNLDDYLHGRMTLSPLESESLLYRAPELLRKLRGRKKPESDPKMPLEEAKADKSLMMQKCDVYSFSIILYELHLHGSLRSSAVSVGARPFGEPEMSAKEILERLVLQKQQKFRPRLDSTSNCPDFVENCLLDCWQETPEARPDFKTIRNRLRPLRKGMKANIFDNMIAMMESYANNLESLVDDRTQLLIDEKRKTEALLFEMLPRTVAEQLRQGKSVDAESFDNVTVYFSDIVGFTLMSAESTPLQVVDFLNDLYTCFDSTIENFDVYKVETIGDAYMVASGLPVRNADRHAGEIASMALTLLERVRKFKVRHRPAETLMLRSGIHSGPVCAGVVGRTMPRFCLFGDTVNTASRMESTGFPLRIHCSSPFRDLLVKLGGYFLEERGYTNLKGKGDQMTYWLIGEDPEKREERMKERAKVLKSKRTRHPSAIDLFRSGSSLRRNSTRRSASRLHLGSRPVSPSRFHIQFKASGGSIAEEEDASDLFLSPGDRRAKCDDDDNDCGEDDDDDDHGSDVFSQEEEEEEEEESMQVHQQRMMDFGEVRELSVVVPRIAKRNSCPCIEKGETSETSFSCGQLRSFFPSNQAISRRIEGLGWTRQQQQQQQGETRLSSSAVLRVPEFFSTSHGIKSVCNASLSSILQHISLRRTSSAAAAAEDRGDVETGTIFSLAHHGNYASPPLPFAVSPSLSAKRIGRNSLRESLKLSKFMRRSRIGQNQQQHQQQALETEDDKGEDESTTLIHS